MLLAALLARCVVAGRRLRWRWDCRRPSAGAAGDPKHARHAGVVDEAQEDGRHRPRQGLQRRGRRRLFRRQRPCRSTPGSPRSSTRRRRRRPAGRRRLQTGRQRASRSASASGPDQTEAQRQFELGEANFRGRAVRRGGRQLQSRRQGLARLVAGAGRAVPARRELVLRRRYPKANNAYEELLHEVSQLAAPRQGRSRGSSRSPGTGSSTPTTTPTG